MATSTDTLRMRVVLLREAGLNEKQIAWIFVAQAVQHSPR